ncbi:hypothetical protein pipiens_015452 [Culex pipiens pipiens]|uniref:Uncharacterized protein n=1 Tax=Culex pipiens pipiens TaxID=38569 RepID=A0ABD1CQD7_CULPP
MRCTTTRSKHFRFRQYVEYSGEMFTSAQFTQRAVLKFAHYTEATLIAGQFTNQFHPARPMLLKFVNFAILCNTKSSHSVGLMWWLLAREELKLRGKISDKWELKPDLFF